MESPVLPEFETTMSTEVDYDLEDQSNDVMHSREAAIVPVANMDAQEDSLFFPDIGDSDTSTIDTLSDDASTISSSSDEEEQSEHSFQKETIDPETARVQATELLEEAEAIDEDDTSDYVIYGIPKSFTEYSDVSSEEQKLIEEEAKRAAKQGAYHDPFIIGLALFWDVYGLTREAYSAFQKLSCLASADTLKKLPESLDALHRWNDKRLPKMELRSKRVPMNLETLPGGVLFSSSVTIRL